MAAKSSLVPDTSTVGDEVLSRADTCCETVLDAGQLGQGEETDHAGYE